MALKEYEFQWSLWWLLLVGIILSCLAFLWSITPSAVMAEDNSDLKKVYHVYAADEHIGTVDNKTMVLNRLAVQLNTVKKNIKKDVNLTWSKPITFIEELTSTPRYTNEAVMSFIKRDIHIKAEAAELKIDDQSVGYFKDRQAAQKVIQNYQSQFVDDDVLEDIISLKQAQAAHDKKIENIGDQKTFNRVKTKNKSLSPGDKSITNVWLSDNISYKDKQVDFDEIATVKQGVKTLQKGTLTDHIHKVEKGDVIESIANTYDLSPDEVLELNPDLTSDSTLQIDQEIQVTQYEPFTKIMVSEEQVKKEKIKHATKHQKTDDLLKGETEVKQTGKDGKKHVRYKVTKADGDNADKQVIEEEIVQEPIKEIILEGTKVIPSRGTKILGWPTNGGYVSSAMGHRWGRMHKGIDIAGPSNRTIKAADNGVVTKAGYSGTYGNRIEINHNNGMKTVYAHMSSINVSVGDVVQKGEAIGIMGATGRSTGIHLHFELYENGSLKNPSEYF